jgi:Na+/H+ antiporter NhaC
MAVSTRSLGLAIVILFEAWMIGALCEDLGTADYLVALMSGAVSPVWLPVLLFVAAGIISFSTGTSWGTMSILVPNVVALAAAVGADSWLGAPGMVVLCIGAVLDGSIFGDHCSPISDTTVLSSVASASDHIDHVRTQAPYALAVGAVALAAGYIPSAASPFWSFPLSVVIALGAFVALFLAVGRNPEKRAG